ncbi:cation efflux protein [Macrolepiota fuliginosa MF-IS2]|uniref:Cation efflux protein n=1 Tax=Macrolepiota fuliginosa MF-IS2 TaxID=1400762 RepID=A0A9P6BZI5_9AGAR|nr:cation efflux protein [Macrolepiota fuliginosa MF-IS2]
MPVPDARTRNKISLNPTKVITTSLSSKQIPKLVAADILFVITLQSAKEWLLDFDVGVFWVVMRVLACGGLGVLVWEVMTQQVRRRKNVEWSALAMAGVLVFVQQLCLFTALYRLSSLRTLMFAYFAKLWVATFISSSSAQKMLAVASAAGLSLLFDTQFSPSTAWRFIPGYGALLLHGLATSALDHTLSVVAPSLGETFAMAAAVLVASIVALPFYVFKTVVLHFPPTPILSLTSLAILPAIAYTLLFYSPLAARSLSHQMNSPGHFVLSFPTVLVASAIFGPLAFNQSPRWSDLAIAGLLYVGMYPEGIEALTSRPRTPTSRLIKLYMKTILSNPESRKIFYFLLLNLCYMLVQMLYGVWTNSLGLISDAIHMAFDCMAIGVGLFASVMATWEPNERFTYGYGRIETLSGFANGIFLILISIFIVFEAIQRILEPPEMNTSQLLLVSTVGLGVNLFGMFAMGGHHHHGHSHSHGHGHGHSHSHVPTPPNLSPAHEASHSLPHSHSHSHTDSHSHSHSHSHSPPASVSNPRIEFPRSDESHHHDHNHEHSHSHSHSDHSHSHLDHGESEHCSHPHSTHTQLHPGTNARSVSFSPSIPPTHSHSHSHSHSQTHLHPRAISFSPTSATTSATRPSHQRSLSLAPKPVTPPASAAQLHLQKHNPGHSRTPSLQIHTSHGPGNGEAVETPLTPNYNFVHDEHLEKHHHVEHHGHSHGHEGHSHNMRGVFLHVMADTLGSVGVIISTLLIQFYGWTGFDPIASLFIAILIAASVLPLVLDTGKILSLDIADRDVKIQEALSELSNIPGLQTYTNPRFWPKDSSALIGSIHIQLAPSAASYDPSGPHSSLRTTYTKIDRVVERVKDVLKERIAGLEEVVVQVEEGPSRTP